MTVLEVELMDIKARLARLEAMVNRLATQPAPSERGGTKRRRPPASPASVDEPMDQEQVIARLKADGFVIEPPPIVRESAAQWEALSPEEQAAVRKALDNLPPGPMASDIIIENRR